MISIVDDDVCSRAAIEGLVRSLGYAAVTFTSAEDFLGSNHVNDTSCLITDVHLPGLTGVSSIGVSWTMDSRRQQYLFQVLLMRLRVGTRWQPEQSGS